jgi:hypothetical protein
MHEGPPNEESAPKQSVFEICQDLVDRGVWNDETVETLNELYENNEGDLSMVYFNYRELELMGELSDYERRLMEWMAEWFEEREGEELE